MLAVGLVSGKVVRSSLFDEPLHIRDCNCPQDLRTALEPLARHRIEPSGIHCDFAMFSRRKGLAGQELAFLITSKQSVHILQIASADLKK